jgi:hypothetical protein
MRRKQSASQKTPRSSRGSDKSGPASLVASREPAVAEGPAGPSERARRPRPRDRRVPTLPRTRPSTSPTSSVRPAAVLWRRTRTREARGGRTHASPGTICDDVPSDWRAPRHVLANDAAEEYGSGRASRRRSARSRCVTSTGTAVIAGRGCASRVCSPRARSRVPRSRCARQGSGSPRRPPSTGASRARGRVPRRSRAHDVLRGT